jgi:hypothetical protein
VPASTGTSAPTSKVIPLAVATVLPGDRPGGLGYIGLGAIVTALLFVGLWAPALLRSVRKRLRGRGSGT